MSDTVLVVDNNHDVVDVVATFFSLRGFTVLKALNGAEALALAHSQHPSVIICDVLMEPMNGFEVLQQIRNTPDLANTILIMASAKAYRSDIDRARQLGANDYVVKPFLMEDLLRVVRHHQALQSRRTMTVTFWGVRGSIATPGPATTRFGGNTSCVELRVGDDILIFDAGTGIRELGQALLKEFEGRPLTIHLFVSHTHWDHIQGFPFFMPAYQPTTTIHVYGTSGQGRPLEKLLRGQMDPDYFPVAFGDMGATLRVHEYRAAPFTIGDTTISGIYLNHPGMNLGYRVTHAGRSFVYATDNEPYRHTLARFGQRQEAAHELGAQLDEDLVQFVAGTDLYVGEAQYTDEEYPAKVGWGHSSVSATVEVALKGNVKALALFHHDPMHSDETVAAMAESAQRLCAARGSALRCFAAYEGQVIEI